jgi:hypothetical protein
MKYALNLADDGRILSATYAEFAPVGSVMVNELPEGNVADYRYVNGLYVHDPLPVEEDHILSDAERIAELEEALAMLLNGVTE